MSMLWNRSAPWYDKTFFAVLYAVLILLVVGLFTSVRPSRNWAYASGFLVILPAALFAIYSGYNLIKRRTIGKIHGWKRWLFFPLGLGVYIWMFWFSILNGIPAVVTSFVHEPQVETLRVIKKTFHTGRRSLCRRGITLEDDLFLLQKPFCIKASDWGDIHVGDTLEVRGRGSWLGYSEIEFRIVSGEPIKATEPQRNMKSIQIAFDRAKADIYRVYSEALMRNPDLQGKITFRISVNEDGHVVESTVSESTLNNNAVPTEILRVIAGINFGRVSVPGITTFNYPIDLVPQ